MTQPRKISTGIRKKEDNNWFFIEVRKFCHFGSDSWQRDSVTARMTSTIPPSAFADRIFQTCIIHSRTEVRRCSRRLHKILKDIEDLDLDPLYLFLHSIRLTTSLTRYIYNIYIFSLRREGGKRKSERNHVDDTASVTDRENDTPRHGWW